MSHNSSHVRKIEDYIEDFDFELDSKIKAEEYLLKLKEKTNELEKELEKLRQQEVESKTKALVIANTMREMGLSEHSIVSAVLAELKLRYKNTNRPTLFTVEDSEIIAFIKSRNEEGATFADLCETFFDINKRELNELLKHLLRNGSIWLKGKTRNRRYWTSP